MKKVIVSTICFLALAASAFAQDAVAQITKDKVGKTVRVSGSVESFSPSRSDTAPASFKLKDAAGGSIRVAVWPDVFNQIAAKDSIKPGAKVDVSAKVAEYKGAIELHVNAAGDVKVGAGDAAAASAPAAPAAITDKPTAAAPAAGGTGISSITKDKLKQAVTISGVVATFSPSRSDTAPASFNLKDDSGSIRVAIWPDVFNQITGKDDIKPGAKVTVKAKVAEFKGNLELHVDSASDVQISGAAAAPAGPATGAASPAASAPTAATAAGGKSGISGLKDKMNQSVTISGKIAKARKPSTDTAPYILNVQGEDGAVDVVFWQALAEQLGAEQKPNVGDSVEISGKVGEFRGNVQVKPEKPSDIKILKGGPSGAESAASAPQAALTEMPLSQIATAQSRQRVKVAGTVETIEPIRAGRRMTIKDQSGTANLLVWDTAVGGKTGIHAVKPSEKITVAATVAEDEGKRVLTVSKPEDVISVGETSK